MPDFHHAPALCDVLSDRTVSIKVFEGLKLLCSIAVPGTNVNAKDTQKSNFSSEGNGRYARPEMIQGAGSVTKLFLWLSLETAI